MRVALEEGVLTLTLDRPDRLNAFTTRMGEEWLEVLDAIDADDAVRAVIVTGAGRAFCAGADLAAGGATFDPGAGGEGASGAGQRVGTRNAAGAGDPGRASRRAARDWGGRVTLRLFACRKPLIAAVNGAAVGVGVTSILPMDVRLASETARFGFVFTRRGIVPEACSSWFLPRVVGISQAMQWVATGRVFDAREALAGGLVSEVLAPDALLPRAREIAREIAEHTSGVSVAIARQMMWQMLGASHPMEAHRLDSAAMHYMGARADSREGVTSFLEKRPPVFPMQVSRDFPDGLPFVPEPPYES
ncbi:MAG: enoyl-CoA hydratase/isomerase family protein [Myxococcales bacterium]|nr:enoyl-CoA hydratase/isomerase family protein [Myxococcales bacterium]